MQLFFFSSRSLFSLPLEPSMDLRLDFLENKNREKGFFNTNSDVITGLIQCEE